jgi:hypothetical protein
MKKFNIKKTIFLILMYIVYVNLFKGYISYTPTLPIYPNSGEEVKKLKEIIKTRNQQDISFFYLTNKSISAAFLPYVNESVEELYKISTSHNNLILFLKYTINRPRPNQVDPSIKPLNIDTAQTPTYPAGHSYQAYLLYKHLSKIYPEKEKLFKEIALRCDDCRVKAGLHYPSDGIFSRRIVDIITKTNYYNKKN